jgi:hypothetical protein
MMARSPLVIKNGAECASSVIRRQEEWGIETLAAAFGVTNRSLFLQLNLVLTRGVFESGRRLLIF